MLSSADRSLVLRDAALPGLELLLDATAMRDLLRSACHGHVDSVTSRYVRYKPGTNALVAYDVCVDGVQWPLHAKALAAPGAAATRDKLRKTEARGRVPSALGFGVFTLPDVAVSVSSFPNDDKVRGLAVIAESGSRRRLLDRAIRQWPELAGGDLLPLAYKPERRFVGALLVGGQPCGVVRAQARGTTLRPTLPASTRLLQLQRVLGRRAWRGLSVTSWIEGETFAALMARGEGRPVAGEIGRALATLHGVPLDGLPERRPADERQALEAAVSLLGAIAPDLAPAARDLATRLAVLLRDPVRPVTIHGDLHPGQLIAGPMGLGLIDLDEVSKGAAVADLASLVASVMGETTTGRLTAATARLLCDDLVEGYAWEAGAVPAGLDTWVAAHLLRRAPEGFRHRRPTWADGAHRMLGLARAVVDTPRWRDSQPRAATRPPIDPAMPALGLASQPRHVEHALAALPGRGWRHVRVCGTRLVRHKPGRRCLIEYDLAGLPPRPDHIVTVVAKMRAKGVDSRTSALMEQLWHGPFGPESAHGASVPQPLGLVPALSSWLQARVSGAAATEWAFGEEGVPVMRRVAGALRLLHTSGIAVHRAHGVADELAALRPRLVHLAVARPALASRVSRLFDACTSSLERVPPGPEVLLHRDFHPDHLLWTGTRLYLIDFDLASAGDAGVDVGNLVAHLIELGLRRRGNATCLQPVIEAFVATYLRDAGEVTPDSVEAWTTAALVRLAALSVDLPGRGHTTDALIELCERRLCASALPCHAAALSLETL